MFGLFKKKSPIEKLELERAKLLKQAYKLSHNNRSESDALMAKADKIEQKIIALKK